METQEYSSSLKLTSLNGGFEDAVFLFIFGVVWLSASPLLSGNGGTFFRQFTEFFKLGQLMLNDQLFSRNSLMCAVSSAARTSVISGYALAFSCCVTFAETKTEIPAFVREAGYTEGIACEGGFAFWAEFDAFKFAISIPETLSGSDAQTGHLFKCMQDGTQYFHQNIKRITRAKADRVEFVLLRPNGEELDIGEWSEISK